MTHVLDDLMQSLKTRVDAKYLSPAVLQEVDDINNANDDLIDQKDVMQIAIPFYQTCIDYLEQWKVQFEDVLIFDWAGLAAAPNWEDVETTIKFMVEKNWLKPEDNNVELFDEFGYILKFITPEKICEWNKKNPPTKPRSTKPHQRWVECFKHFQSNNVPYTRFARIIEFIFCLPATSASVERIFSLIAKLWTKEKSQLKLDTLKHMLFLKYNLKFECVEFYNFLKESPTLLKQISSQDKYDFQQKATEN